MLCRVETERLFLRRRTQSDGRVDNTEDASGAGHAGNSPDVERIVDHGVDAARRSDLARIRYARQNPL